MIDSGELPRIDAKPIDAIASSLGPEIVWCKRSPDILIVVNETRRVSRQTSIGLKRRVN